MSPPAVAPRPAGRLRAPGAPAATPPGRVVPLYRADERHPQAQVCRRCTIRSEALFGALDETALDRIHVHIAELMLAPGEPLSRRGDDAALYTVRAGVVRAERSTTRGDRRIVRLAGAGALIGQEALLGRRSDDEWVACTAAQLCRIPASLVRELLRSEPALGQALMQRWQSALDDTEAWLADLATGPARRRVVRLVQRLAGLGDGRHLWLPRRSEMGAMLDLTLETASRQISALRRDGVLTAVGPGGAEVSPAALAAALRAADDA
ncbi:MAG: Crp/Fnr family transcriptional regulator [Rubrivivax sp.]|nr:Crp/Fnr family transcriptional regulator [Rubrivivax sp.]